MVLPAPAPDDEVPPADAGWVEQIRASLKLAGGKGILVHVDRAVPERLGDLVRGLYGDFPDIDVHADLGALETAPEGSTLVLIPRPEHADALNLGRPVFSRRRLKVVLWCDHETTVALAQRAPDLFDWISEHHDCPPGAVPHAVAGLEAAEKAKAPGIVWRGSGDQEDKRRLLAAFEAAFPAETLTWVDPKRDYEALLGAVRERKAQWIACRAQAASHVRRLRWAMAEVEKRGRAIIVTDIYPCPGWWPVHGRLLPFAEARRTLEAAGSRIPGALAALTDLEPEAVELAGALLREEKDTKDLHGRLRSARDPGAEMAKAAREADLVQQLDVAAGGTLPPVLALPPVLRAYAATPEVFARHPIIAATDMGIGGTPQQDPKDIRVMLDVETRIQPKMEDEALARLARLALDAGEDDVAGVWVMRTKTVYLDTYNRNIPSTPMEKDVDALVRKLVVRGERRVGSLIVQKWGHFGPAQSFWGLVVFVGLVLNLIGVVHLPEDAKIVWMYAPMLGYPLAWYLDRVARRRELRSAQEAKAAAATGIGPRVRDASILLHRGAYGDAARALDAVIATGCEQLTEEHPDVRRANLLLARALLEQTEDERARSVLEHAVAVEGRVAGVETPLFTALALSLAALLPRIGRARDADEILRKLLGPDAPTPLPSETQPEAQTYPLAHSANAEVDDYLQLLLALPKPPILSDEQRAEGLRLLAEAWITQGRYDEAERLLERTIGQADAALPTDHIERWRTLTTYGRVLFLQRRPGEAEPVLRRALALTEEHAGERHPDTARILTELARVEHALSRPEAAASARRALGIYEGAQLSDTAKALARAELGPIAG